MPRDLDRSGVYRFVLLRFKAAYYGLGQMIKSLTKKLPHFLLLRLHHHYDVRRQSAFSAQYIPIVLVFRPFILST